MPQGYNDNLSSEGLKFVNPRYREIGISATNLKIGEKISPQLGKLILQLLDEVGKS
jgi:hypothetical protein